MKLNPTILSLFLLSSTALADFQHDLLYTHSGLIVEDFYATSISSTGDINSDGYPDYIVGAPNHHTLGVGGKIILYSGKDGSEIRNHVGYSGSLLGTAVHGGKDVNGDGVSDYIAGSRLDDNVPNDQAGSAKVFSGATGELICTVYGEAEIEQMGMSVRLLDINGDQQAEFAVGAPYADYNGLDSGRVRIYEYISNTNSCELVYSLDGQQGSDQLGTSIAAADFDQDGFDDLAIGAVQAFSPGYVSIFSGISGALIHTVHGFFARDGFGASVAEISDVNSDQIPDLIVGAPQWYAFTSGSGYINVYSGLDWTMIFSANGKDVGDWFGRSVSQVGDLNGDEKNDVLVGATQFDNLFPFEGKTGYVHVLSGSDGNLLFERKGHSPFDTYGRSVSEIGDLNHDGYSEWVVGASIEDPSNALNPPGYVEIYNGSPVSQIQAECDAPTLSSSVASIGNSLEVSGSGFPPLTVVTPFWSPIPEVPYFDAISGCKVHLDLNEIHVLDPIQANLQGDISFSIPVSANPQLIQLEIGIQAIFETPQGYGISNALHYQIVD